MFWKQQGNQNDIHCIVQVTKGYQIENLYMRI